MHFGQIILPFLTIWISVEAFPDCSQSYYSLGTNQMVTINSPNYPPYGFPAPSSCQSTISAPIYHELTVSCYFYIGNGQSSSCDPNDSLYIQVDGSSRMQNGRANQFCGSGLYTPNIKSSFNSIAIGYTASSYSGFYQCNVTATAKNQCDCGARTTTRIVGGKRATANKYPYMAAIQKYNSYSSAPLLKGGASIISSNAVLCAAHVFYENNQLMTPSQMFVTVGRDDLRNDVQTDTPYSANYEIDRIIIHPDYDNDNDYGTNDIAVVLLKRFISFNRGVQPCCMPGLNEQESEYQGQQVTELGYGSTSFGGDYSYFLKETNASVTSNYDCSTRYGDDLTISAQDMCTLSADKSDTCQGDSGGPIISSSYRDFLIAIVKTGADCGSGDPAVCQRVSPYRPWIEKECGTQNYFCYYK